MHPLHPWTHSGEANTVTDAALLGLGQLSVALVYSEAPLEACMQTLEPAVVATPHPLDPLTDDDDAAMSGHFGRSSSWPGCTTRPTRRWPKRPEKRGSTSSRGRRTRMPPGPSTRPFLWN